MLKYVIALGAFFVSASIAQAACLDGAACSAATTYEITINKVEFCKSSDCTNAVTVSSTAADFDIAASSVGAAVGNYANLDEVAAGVYTHIRTTIDGDIVFIAPGAGTCAAHSSTLPVTVATPAIGTALDLPANSDLGLDVVGSELIHLHELSTPLTITKAGSLPQVQIDFSTADGHLCYSGASFPGVPSVSIRVFEN